jgi:hypothetical protein
LNVLILEDHLLTTTEHEKEVAERILGYKFEKALGNGKADL